ncbi:MAG: flavin reductase family protein [Treponema sp.]|jgi:flavin reductase (DIM6/NTAB) family NADH-FMN oxidoreductase RutF|nr:flavin reductase family protein [Treponema sp.]
MADFNETDLQQAYQMIKPAAVVATKGEHSYNLTPYGWIMPLDYEPVTKVIFSSDPSHQAVANIKRTKEFAVCIPLRQDDPFIEQTGSVSDAKADKFKMFGIQGEKAEKVDVLLPKDKISGWIECRFVRSITEGSVELIIGEAVAAYKR